MNRNMDLIRLLLQKFADDPRFDGRGGWVINGQEFSVDGFSDKEIDYHLGQLIDAGLLESGGQTSSGYMIKKVTWRGHEFLDDTRDPDIWKKVKGGAHKVSGVGFSLAWEIAKAEIKMKLGLPTTD